MDNINAHGSVVHQDPESLLQPLAAISTSRPTPGKASRSTGPSATATSRRGTRTWSGSSACRAWPRGWTSCPTGSSCHRWQFHCAETALREAAARTWGRDRVLTIGRCAILTVDHNGRAACHYCGPCERGCITHSYFSSIGSTLPAARRDRPAHHPALTAWCESVVFDRAPAPGNRCPGDRCQHASRCTEYRARVVFLCASALESARILLNSKSSEFPDGLGSSSGELGHNVMDHHLRRRRARHHARL